ncbi:putative clathrin assembly protein [Dichanthelium oligosanthes]|uniref:Putative clathrin assembly protein n=1 Tax=Dichanthelium oligosanthes TaxID=888268 RepID=A0A1E5UXS3_9POAL|nr:putative clathrin assembly protein [Dichanthelium oligosanthes]
MAPSKLRQALGAVKDQTSIGLAKVGSGGSVTADLDVAIVRATSHSESFPADERHIREILALTCLSRGYVGACVSSLSRRLGRTRSWAVALKTLVIVHRLLADGDPAFEQEVFYATRRGTRMLNMFDFCDRSRADAWDFSAFVRTYAAYLDDRLEYRMQGRHGGAAPRGGRPLREEMYASPGNRYTCDITFNGRQDDTADAEADRALALVTRDPPTSEMTVDQLLIKANQLHHLLDRFVACIPVGAAKANRVVAVSLYPLVKESVQLYCELTEVMAALIEQFAEMETADCERVHTLFCGLAKQMEELEAFYSWCKASCVCRQSDVPEVEVVTQKKLELMDEFIRDRHAAASQQRLPPPSPEPAASPEPVLVEEEEDMNATKALPAPEEPPAAAREEETAKSEPEAPLVVADPINEEADFLNLKADAMSSEEHGQQLALALFDGNPAGSAPKGDVFDHSASDWETALVQSASALANQRAELCGGLNMMVLDGMYSHAAVASTQTFSGSASSVALRPPGAPMLALPAPPGASSAAAGADPFAASALVPPPTYVQMSDMQAKQQFLTQEQIVWQQYGKNGMQGQGALAMLEQRPQILPHGSYNYPGYHRTC